MKRVVLFSVATAFVAFPALVGYSAEPIPAGIYIASGFGGSYPCARLIIRSPNPYGHAYVNGTCGRNGSDFRPGNYTAREVTYEDLGGSEYLVHVDKATFRMKIRNKNLVGKWTLFDYNKRVTFKAV